MRNFSFLDVQHLDYPSVSVCPEYALKEYIDEEIDDPNLDMDTKEMLMKTNVWWMNETFYFVNQKTSENGGFPCFTTSSSSDPGRPCSFPFRCNLINVHFHFYLPN